MTVDTTTPIGAYWEKNKDVLGAATGEQQTFANGSTQQTFENGVVTQGKYGGVQAVTGAAGEAFMKAGGAEKFGNAESAPGSTATVVSPSPPTTARPAGS